MVRLREHEEWFAWIGGASLATVVVSALLVPVLIRHMPMIISSSTARGPRG